MSSASDLRRSDHDGGSELRPLGAGPVDWDAVYELVGPDIVWEVRSDFPDAGVYTGYEGLRRWSSAFDEAVEETWYQPLEFIHRGDHVVVPLRWGGRGRGSLTPFAEG